jgi:hypothetical protein
MPGAEVVVGLIAGGFNVGSFFLGSAPDAISRLNNQSTVNVDLKMAEGNAEFVLQTLMDYGKVITIEEYKWLKGAYLK